MKKSTSDDRDIDRLLAEALHSDARPSEAAVRELKRRMSRRATGQGPSLWWLPALSGTAVTACALCLMTYLLDWKCLVAAAAVGAAFVLSAWLLTLVGLKKFDLMQEARKLI